MNHSQNIVQTLDKILNDQKCCDLAREHGFVQRASSKLKGHEFIKVMILPSEGVSRDSLKGLCKRMNTFNHEADLSSQALCERINDEHAAALMQAVFANVLSTIRLQMIDRCPQLAQSLGKFNAVFIEDSTVCALNEKLKVKYEGNRGAVGPKSQVKIDLIYEVMQKQIVNVELHSGKKTDQGLAGRIINYIKNGDLVIRDLGYFVLEYLQAIIDQGAYFLSRLLPNVKIYLKKDQPPVDLGKYLAEHYPRHNIIELNTWLGDGQVAARMVIYRLPQEVINQRLRAAKKRAKDTGRTISKGKLLCMHFAIFVTNVPVELLCARVVGTIYRLRWEIELVFKRWKGQLAIDYLQGIHKNRIDCLIWGRLCMVVIIGMISGYFSRVSIEVFKVELSDVKLIAYLLRGDNFCRAVWRHKLEDFMEELGKDLCRMLSKDKRKKRKTMRERIMNGESYYNIENQEVA
jgi:hypothetical protein